MILIGDTEDLGENLSQCHFVYHKSNMVDPGANPGLCGWRPLTNSLSHGTALHPVLPTVVLFVFIYRLSSLSLRLRTDKIGGAEKD
jgi:hypothetical protein